MDKKSAVVEAIKILSETLNPGEVADWFATSCGYLDGEPPANLVETQWERVLAAAKAFRESR